jgi:hypothetical protein
MLSRINLSESADQLCVYQKQLEFEFGCRRGLSQLHMSLSELSCLITKFGKALVKFETRDLLHSRGINFDLI